MARCAHLPSRTWVQYSTKFGFAKIAHLTAPDHFSCAARSSQLFSRGCMHGFAHRHWRLVWHWVAQPGPSALLVGCSVVTKHLMSIMAWKASGVALALLLHWPVCLVVVEGVPVWVCSCRLHSPKPPFFSPLRGAAPGGRSTIQYNVVQCMHGPAGLYPHPAAGRKLGVAHFPWGGGGGGGMTFKKTGLN